MGREDLENFEILVHLGVRSLVERVEERVEEHCENENRPQSQVLHLYGVFPLQN